jgi:hypothetical protein
MISILKDNKQPVDWHALVKVRIEAWWHRVEDWLPFSKYHLPYYHLGSFIRLFECETDPLSQETAYLPADQRGIIPDKLVWHHIRDRVDLFYSTYDNKEIDKHNWGTLAAHEASAWRESTRPKFLEGYVYLASAGNLTKVGRSINPQKRVKELDSPNGAEIKLLHTIPTADMVYLENAIHSLYRDKQVSGEWFTLKDQDISTILRLRASP